MLRSFTSNQLKKSLSIIGSKPFATSAACNGLNEEWKKLAQKQLKDKPVDSLGWNTPEVI